MAALHRSESDIGWMKRRIMDLEKKVEQLGAARRLEAATIGAGGLHVRGGDVFLKAADGTVLWQASQDPIKTRGAFGKNSGLSIPGTWTDVLGSSQPVPKGYLGEGHFLMTVSVGNTMSSGNGSVSCQPLFRYRFTDNSVSSWSAGPAIASPENRITVASSFWAANFPMTGIVGHETKTVSHVEFGISYVRSFGTETGTDGNWHVAASAIFKRGGTL